MGDEQVCDVADAEETLSSPEENERRYREVCCQQAVYVLQQAQKIRADAAFMTDIRAYVRKLQGEGASLLDDLD